MDLAGLSGEDRPSRILVLNPGSSSLKATLVEQPGDRTVDVSHRDWGADSSAYARRGEELRVVVHELTRSEAVDAVGYRVVHGGSRFTQPTLIDDDVVAGIRQLDALAPLHNEVAAATIEAGRRLFPEVSHIACFDTAFHATLPEARRRYPLPTSWYVEWDIRRYGFHGLSVMWSLERAAALLDRSASELQLVVAHLGSGCSVTAVADGRSVDTSMGMTPLEGLMMGTRSGSVDPGILLYLLRSGRATGPELEAAMAHRSGLVAVAGTSDVRELEAQASAGLAEADLAIEMFARRAAAGIAGIVTSLERLDALIFTGGIGEHSHLVRTRICAALRLLGIAEPQDRPEAEDAILSGIARPAVLRVSAREDLVISRQVASML